MRCACAERHRPIGPLGEGSNQRPRQWFVLRRNYSRSAFNGYRSEWSDYSDVQCRVCRNVWRTKAPYVHSLQDCEYFPSRNAPKMEAIQQ